MMTDVAAENTMRSGTHSSRSHYDFDALGSMSENRAEFRRLLHNADMVSAGLIVGIYEIASDCLRLPLLWLANPLYVPNQLET